MADPVLRCRPLAWMLGAGLCAQLAACSLFGGGVPRVDIGEVRVQLAPDANFNSPVTLGVVLVADRELEKRVLDPAGPWLDIDADLAAAYPQVLRAWRCELTGGQEMALPATLFKGARAYSVIVLAAVGGAERRARIDGWKDGGLITVARDHWQIEPGNASRSRAAQRPAMQCKPSERAL